MDEATLIHAYGGVQRIKPTEIERWVIREIEGERKNRYYVRDNHLGYATDLMTFEEAVREAKQRNAAEVDSG
jgi:hypothetical protein